MQTLPVLVVAVLAACASSFAVYQITQEPRDEGATGAAAQLQARIAELQDRQDELERAVAKKEWALSGVGATRTSMVEVSDEQVRRVLEDMMSTGQLDLSAVQDASADKPTVDATVMFARLTDANLSYDQSELLWKEVREAGLLDEMVEKFEALAKAQPDVADAQVALGSAYLQKLFTVGDNEKGVLAMKADQAFDEALDINPQHWDARFSKAVSLSFWPAFLGRGSDAMEHFGVLLEQQEASGASKPQYSQTYLFLGNMHEQRGNMDEARKVWQRGYDLHPASEELRHKVVK